MRTLAFDGRMGASGDMLLGALIAAGGDPGVLGAVEAVVPVRYEVGTATKNGIAATSVDVLATGGDRAASGDDGVDHAHGGGDRASASPADSPAEGGGPSRGYGEVVEIVGGMDLPDPVEADARAVVELLAEAESTVHGTETAEATFHEVGADDAIADIVGACLLLDDLGVDDVVTTPLATGDGTVETAHGTYPVPVPAVVELAGRADWSLRGGPVEAELLTPTGAAVLAHFAGGVETLPELAVDASGYGAGGYDFPDRPNVLRAVVGERREGLTREGITVLETHVDDATPETLGALQDTLPAVGALDVAVIPATMKKSRPGHLVKVVTRPEDATRVARRLAAETGTLGVREHGAGHRWTAHREIRAVEVEIDDTQYQVDVKVASDDSGEVFDVSAEYDDAAAVAAETGVAVREVMRRAETAARE